MKRYFKIKNFKECKKLFGGYLVETKADNMALRNKIPIAPDGNWYGMTVYETLTKTYGEPFACWVDQEIDPKMFKATMMKLEEVPPGVEIEDLSVLIGHRNKSLVVGCIIKDKNESF
jgi:hypothetical protein